MAAPSSGPSSSGPPSSGPPPARPRLAFLSHHDPFDRNSFSGTAFFMRRALEARAEVAVPGHGASARAGARLLRLARLGRGAARRLGMGEADPAMARRREKARRQEATLRAARRMLGSEAGPGGEPEAGPEAGPGGGGFDAALAVVSSGLVAGLAGRTAVPLVHVTDATPAYIAEGYGRPPRPGAHETEARAIAAAAAVVYSSHYMAERALAEFGPALGEGLSAKLHVVPFGLNLEAAPEPRLDVAAPARGEPLRLVFIGKDWARKGGEIALGALRWLRAQGADARLTVLGSRPPGGAAEAGEPGLEVIPFLDKNRPRDAARFAGILGAAHLLVLPTRADCTPMVVAEANSFGVPALATDLGGLGTLVAAGETGRLIPPAAGGAEWGRQVLEATADPAAYAALRRAAHARYRRRLTWEAWSDGVLEVAAGLPAPVPDRAAG